MSVSKYLFIVSMNVKTEYEDLFNEVYDDEHCLLYTSPSPRD